MQRGYKRLFYLSLSDGAMCATQGKVASRLLNLFVKNWGNVSDRSQEVGWVSALNGRSLHLKRKRGFFSGLFVFGWRTSELLCERQSRSDWSRRSRFEVQRWKGQRWNLADQSQAEEHGRRCIFKPAGVCVCVCVFHQYEQVNRGEHLSFSHLSSLFVGFSDSRWRVSRCSDVTGWWVYPSARRLWPVTRADCIICAPDGPHIEHF